MRKILFTLIALVATSVASAQESSNLDMTFGCSIKEKRCIVRNNEGGDVLTFMRAAREIKDNHIELVIAGNCRSSCAMVADLSRMKLFSPQSCVTPEGELYFHQGYNFKDVGRGREAVWVFDGRSILPRTDPIDKWNRERGGWATIGYNVMRYPETLKYWHKCSLIKELVEKPVDPIIPVHMVHGLY